MDVQKELSVQEFEEHISYIERIFTDPVAARFKKMNIMYLMPGIFEQKHIIATTYNDLCSVMDETTFTWMDELSTVLNPIVHQIRKPRKREFTSMIKFTPPSTIAYQMGLICPKKYGDEMNAVVTNVYPMYQDKNVIAEANDDDYVARHAIHFLNNKKGMSLIEAANLPTCMRNEEEAISKTIQYGIARMYEASMSWAICYDWKDLIFTIPMERKYIYDIFKKRDKTDGRRQKLPYIVEDYRRKDGKTIKRHFAAASPLSENRIILNGREYAILIGPEDYESCLPGSKKTFDDIRKVCFQGESK